MKWKEPKICYRCKKLVEAGQEMHEIRSKLSADIRLHICEKCNEGKAKIKLKRR